MAVDVVDAFERLTAQPRSIEVVDVAVVSVEDVEHVERDTDRRGEPVAGREVDEARRPGADRVVIDEGTWPEVAPSHAAGDPPQRIHGGSGRDDGGDGAR